MSLKRDNYLSWDEFFIGIAKLAAGRSKDPNTQVGACIVGKDNRILSIGYNGAPNKFDDENFPWAREGDDFDTKYAYVCHAELNAILNFPGSRKDLIGSTIYVDVDGCTVKNDHSCPGSARNAQNGVYRIQISPNGKVTAPTDRADGDTNKTEQQLLLDN